MLKSEYPRLIASGRFYTPPVTTVSPTKIQTRPTKARRVQNAQKPLVSDSLFKEMTPYLPLIGMAAVVAISQNFILGTLKKGLFQSQEATAKLVKKNRNINLAVTGGSFLGLGGGLGYALNKVFSLKKDVTPVVEDMRTFRGEMGTLNGLLANQPEYEPRTGVGWLVNFKNALFYKTTNPVDP